MGAQAIVMNDQITGICPNHLMIGPLGVPIPAGPLPFSAPLTMGLVQTVLIGGKPAAVQTSSGYNTPPHVNLHASDPFLLPTLEIGQVIVGSPTVLIGGLPAAKVGDMAICVGPPDAVVKGSATVHIMGLPAARMGDKTAHGGTIVLGLPTVQIGG